MEARQIEAGGASWRMDGVDWASAVEMILDGSVGWTSIRVTRGRTEIGWGDEGKGDDKYHSFF